MRKDGGDWRGGRRELFNARSGMPPCPVCRTSYRGYDSLVRGRLELSYCALGRIRKLHVAIEGGRTNRIDAIRQAK